MQDKMVFVAGLHRLIPDDYILKKVGMVLRTGWVRGLVRDCYSEDRGRPSIDPEAR